MHSDVYLRIVRVLIYAQRCISLHSEGIYLCDGQFEGTAHRVYLTTNSSITGSQNSGHGGV